ncbi:MAG: VanZ family protein [Tenacibaculum sp.]
MLKHIKNLLKDNLNIIAILLTISIAILSLIKIEKQPIQVNGLDKIEHALAYFVLTLLWLLALKKSKIRGIVVIICCFLYGIVIEVLQVTTTSYRSGEILDVVANSTGILIAYIIYLYFFKKNEAI